MNLKTQFSDMGVNLKDNVSPSKFIQLVSACPLLIQSVPQLGSLISTLQTIIGGYNKITQSVADAEAAIVKQENLIDTAQSSINKANEAYTSFLSTSPIAFEGTGVGEVVVKPTAANVTMQQAITAADETLENYKTGLKTLKSELAKLKEQLAQYEQKMNDTTKAFVKSIINTKVS